MENTTGDPNIDNSGGGRRGTGTKQIDMESEVRKLTLLPMESTTGASNKEKKRVGMETGGGNQTLLPMENTADSNEPNKRVDKHIRKDKSAAYSTTGFSKHCIERKDHKQICLERMIEQRFLMGCPYKDLIVERSWSWRDKVLAVLNVVRRWEITEVNPKTGWCGPTRFCEFYNMAFFDFDKESNIVHGPLFHDIPRSKYLGLDDSVNVISIKVAQSDVRYPVSIYGTVLARDVNDYRCVYLFRRGRDDPQLITRKNRMLALTGPYRALGGTDYMYFEFHLKVKGDGAVDEDFSKGLVERAAYRDTLGIPSTFTQESYLSTVELMCMHVPFALEASIGVHFLNGKSTFTGKVFASTSRSCTTKMVLYDSQVAGTKTEFGSGGSVSLSRHIVAVSSGEDLLLYFDVCDNCNKSRRIKFVIANGVEERACNIGSYQLEVKIIWKGVFRQQPTALKHIGGQEVFW
ncbi:unnamed protein product [Urochloa humidicola]